MDRRKFLKQSVSLGASASLASAAGCGDQPTDIPLPAPISVEDKRRLRWTNWAANQSCLPQWRIAPATTDELVESLKKARGVIRPVGSGHSFSSLVPTTDSLLSTDLLSGVVSTNGKNLSAKVLGGTRLGGLGPMLDQVGQAMPNLPDIDYPSVAGALSTSTHGTGKLLGSIASQVSALTIATTRGELVYCDSQKDSDLFNAARTSLGSLGVIAEVTLQNQKPFSLTEVTKVEELDAVLEDINLRAAENRHFEIFPFPHSSVCMTVATNHAGPKDRNKGAEDVHAVDRIKDLYDALARIPRVGFSLYSRIFSTVLGMEPETIRTGKSFDVLAHVRIVRFREMEYTVPAEQGPACLREIMRTIKEKRLPVFFPLEYRYVKADSAWLSMFEGQDGCSISVHQYGSRDYKSLFAEIEPIFWKYSGRPHWGKIHTLSEQQLAPLYSKHWQDFQQIRRELDPDGRMLNSYLKQLLGA